MASLSSQVANALSRYWSEIYGGAAAKLSTSDMWSNINARAQASGLSSAGVTATAVSTLRGFASSMINAANRLAAADPELGLSAAFIAEAPWSRPLQQQTTMPIYQIGFDNTIELPDGTISVARQTITVTGQLPQTVGDLYGVVGSEAGTLASEGSVDSTTTPRGTSLGVDNLQILSV
jgi:protoporphyrinogen oxidase